MTMHRENFESALNHAVGKEYFKIISMHDLMIMKFRVQRMAFIVALILVCGLTAYNYYIETLHWVIRLGNVVGCVISLLIIFGTSKLISGISAQRANAVIYITRTMLVNDATTVDAYIDNLIEHQREFHCKFGKWDYNGSEISFGEFNRIYKE